MWGYATRNRISRQFSQAGFSENTGIWFATLMRLLCEKKRQRLRGQSGFHNRNASRWGCGAGGSRVLLILFRFSFHPSLNQGVISSLVCH
jgi:hypothetical protein